MNWKKQDDWFWEGNVQARIVLYLREKGYTTTAANTLTKERGPDVLSAKGNERILFEVKGWPSDKYADGPKAGEKKKANPNTQAGNWFSQALLTMMEAKTKYPGHKLVLAFPDFQRYRRLAEATKASLEILDFEIWFVSKSNIDISSAKPLPSGSNFPDVWLTATQPPPGALASGVFA